MSVNPITPEEAKKNMIQSFPDYVIESVNELIVENSRGSSSITILREEVIKRIQSKNTISRDDIFNKHLLDFEDVYQEKGWAVAYEQPCLGEDFKAYYKFTPKK